jgi:Fe-Mn family superoxide dismutase
VKSLIKKTSILLEQIKKSENEDFLLTEMKKIGIEKLPYSYSSLKQFIDSETMDVHYNKHYKGYVKKLNDVLSKKDYGDLELEQIVKSISRFPKVIRNNAGGAFNHALFWKMLSPKKQNPSEKLLEKINKHFESFKNFKSKFEDVAQKRFGSGWVWLVLTKKGRLKIMSTPNQDNPLMNVIKRGGYPLLGLDLWEHAYYLKYQNKRDEYIKGFWDFVNWEFVNKMYEMKTKTTLNENYFKRIILESASEKCSPAQNNFYRQLFNNNPHIKAQFNEKIEEVFSQVFPDNYYRRNEYAPGTLRGLYDFMGEPGRSPLNRVNTNYTCFCILVNDINKVILSMGRRPINFSENNIDTEITRLLNAISHFKERIFNINSGTFKALIETVKKTGGFGDNNENYVVKKLKEKLGDNNVRKVASIGNLDDTLRGVDCELIYDGRKYTAQIKPFTSVVKTDDNKLKIIGGGGVKIYRTDLLIFTNRKEIYAFNNIDTEIDDGDYLIPSKNLVFKLD